MTDVEREGYFHWNLYYPASDWVEPLCQRCRDNSLPCDFDTENNMCRQCRASNRMNNDADPYRRLCRTHRAEQHLPVRCGQCRFIRRRVCEGCLKFRQNQPNPCTFDGAAGCRQCQWSYKSGEISRNGCRELCVPCQQDLRNGQSLIANCGQCTVHQLYQSPGKYPHRMTNEMSF